MQVNVSRCRENKGDEDRRRKRWHESKKPGACFQYRREGRYKCDFPSERQRNFTLDVAVGMESTSHWILDNGSSRHVVTREGQLYDVEECDDECMLPNGESMGLHLKGRS